MAYYGRLSTAGLLTDISPGAPVNLSQGDTVVTLNFMPGFYPPYGYDPVNMVAVPYVPPLTTLQAQTISGFMQQGAGAIAGQAWAQTHPSFVNYNQQVMAAVQSGIAAVQGQSTVSGVMGVQLNLPSPPTINTVPRLQNSIAVQLFGLTSGQKNNIVTALFSGGTSPPLWETDTGPSACTITAMTGAVIGSNGLVSFNQFQQLLIAAIFVSDNPTWLINPVFDPSIMVPGSTVVYTSGVN